MNYKHGESSSALYKVWQKMMDRCYNTDNKDFPRYGGRGIAVCEEWKEDRATFFRWARANGWEVHLTLERNNTNKHYEPSNCSFATRADQNNNLSTNVLLTAFGETKTMAQWSNDPRCLVSYSCLKYRIGIGWEHEKALTTCSRKLQNSQAI